MAVSTVASDMESPLLHCTLSTRRVKIYEAIYPTPDIQTRLLNGQSGNDPPNDGRVDGGRRREWAKLGLRAGTFASQWRLVRQARRHGRGPSVWSLVRGNQGGYGLAETLPLHQPELEAMMNKLLASAAVALGLSLAAGTASATTFTVSWWGYNGEKLQANVIEPFKKICGCDVVFETGNNADRLNKLPRAAARAST